MINKLKYMFLMIFCIGLVGGTINVFAQINDRILVAANKPLKQSDVDTMIEFYEWAFEKEFTTEQRREFQKNTEIEFKNNPTESRKVIDDLVNTFPKIQAADKDLQKETRKNFLDLFVEDLRSGSDENSQLLLSIYESKDGSNSEEFASNVETDNSNIESVGSISALVGKWFWGRSGSMTTTTSGVYLGGNGSRHTYQFFANGTVQYTGIMNVMTGGCRMQIFKSAKGKAALKGDSLTINWSPASFSREDSCSPSKNYKKTMPAETEKFRVGFKDSYGQKELCLTGTDEMCFSPTK